MAIRRDVSWNVFWIVLVLGILIAFSVLMFTFGRISAKPKVVLIKQVNEPTTASFNMNAMAPPPSNTSNLPPVYPQKAPMYPMRGMDFQQLGVLVSKDIGETEPVILPLFGRRMPNRANRWEYYVASKDYHMWRLPVQMKNRLCDDDVGCEEIFNGDEVVVPDYANKVFYVRLYKLQEPILDKSTP